MYQVARNKAKDHFKRATLFETQIKAIIKPKEYETIQDFEFSSQTIADSQLAMVFAVCNPGNSPEAQICLALQTLCGFSVAEIANAFLTKTETVKKRLHRAKTNLRNNNFQIKTLSKAEVGLRLDTVLRTLYLLFNEGYFSKTNNLLIRKDLCAEAIRLTLLLTDSTLTNKPQTNALLALMCFQSSRLDARTNAKNEAVLFEQQDKSLWDKTLIDRGNYYLVKACTQNEISKYHLEAGIAYWHSTPIAENKWQHILQLYNQLILIEYSPVTALNSVFAFAKVYGHDKAIPEAEKLGLTESNYYHELLGYLYTGIDNGKAIYHYQQAIELTKSKTEQRLLIKEIKQLSKTV